MLSKMDLQAKRTGEDFYTTLSLIAGGFRSKREAKVKAETRSSR